MPKTSERAHVMPESPIRKLAPAAEAAARRGVVIHHLNIGQPDVESPSEFWARIKSLDLKTLEYSHSAGIPRVREKVVASYRAQGFPIEFEDLMITMAGSEALMMAMFACFDPGDELIVMEPMYANYIGFSVPFGVRIVPIGSRIEDGFGLPAPEEFERHIGPRTRGILICNPNNPTGTVYPRAHIEALGRLCLKHDLFLIADEVYREFNYTGEPHFSVLHLPGLEQHAIMTDSVSKRFSLCGARVGFLISRNREVMHAALKFAQARLSPPTLETLGLEGALETPPEYFARVREEYRRRRDLVYERINRIPGALCPRSEGAFYAMIRLPVDDSDRFCQWLLEEFEHEGETVMLAPGSGFYETEGRGRDEVRLAYVEGSPRLERALDCLERALELYPGRVRAESGAGL